MTLRFNVRPLLVPALLALSSVPILFSALRVFSLAGGAEVTPETARFFDSPLPVLLHVISASLFTAVGAFQFAEGFRLRHPRWHRVAGRGLWASGLVAALSGIWMTLFYPRAVGDGPLLDLFRLLFGAAMALCLVLGLVTVLRRDFAGHRAWMIRAYAIGLGAGTQVLVSVPWFLAFGQPGVGARAWLLGGAWILNAAVAEGAIRFGFGSPGGRRNFLRGRRFVLS